MAERKVEYKVSDPPIKTLVLDRLKSGKYAKVAAKLADEFVVAGITPETIHNAPVLVTTTHGADIYEVVKLLEAK